MFDFIISKVNLKLGRQGANSAKNFKNSVKIEPASSKFIGILDMAGFEYFDQNSFEQFCINYSNEHLQKYFNDKIIVDELKLYQTEGILLKQNSEQVKNLVQQINDISLKNVEVIHLIENEIVPILNDSSKFLAGKSGGSQKMRNFSSSALAGGDNFYQNLPAKIKPHRKFSSDYDPFLVNHFAERVVYNSENFVSKNIDNLHASLVFCISESRNEILKSMVEQSNEFRSVGKLNQETVISKFKTQLRDLMSTLNLTNAHFIRCIKPNDLDALSKFHENKIQKQLKFSGIQEAVKVLKQGYPSRIKYQDLPQFEVKLLPKFAQANYKLIYSAILKNFGNFNKHEYEFGINMIFLKNNTFSKFDKLVENLSGMSEREKVEFTDKLKKILYKNLWNSGLATSKTCGILMLACRQQRKIRYDAAVVIQKHYRLVLNLGCIFFENY